MTVKARSDQHRTGPRPSRLVGPHEHFPVRRANGDDYCRACGEIITCHHRAGRPPWSYGGSLSHAAQLAERSDTTEGQS